MPVVENLKKRLQNPNVRSLILRPSKNNKADNFNDWELRTHLFPLIKKLDNLEEIFITDTEVTSMGFQDLLDLVSSQKKLQKLRLRNNKFIDDSGLIGLGDFLARNSTIRHLDIAYSSVKPAVKDGMIVKEPKHTGLAYLISQLEHAPTLEKITLSGPLDKEIRQELLTSAKNGLRATVIIENAGSLDEAMQQTLNEVNTLTEQNRKEPLPKDDDLKSSKSSTNIFSFGNSKKKAGGDKKSKKPKDNAKDKKEDKRPVAADGALKGFDIDDDDNIVIEDFDDGSEDDDHDDSKQANGNLAKSSSSASKFNGTAKPVVSSKVASSSATSNGQASKVAKSTTVAVIADGTKSGKPLSPAVLRLYREIWKQNNDKAAATIEIFKHYCSYNSYNPLDMFRKTRRALTTPAGQIYSTLISYEELDAEYSEYVRYFDGLIKNAYITKHKSLHQLLQFCHTQLTQQIAIEGSPDALVTMAKATEDSCASVTFSPEGVLTL